MQGEDTETPVIDLLEGKDFSHIVFFFGENELGWSNRSAFTTTRDLVYPDRAVLLPGGNDLPVCHSSGLC